MLKKFKYCPVCGSSLFDISSEKSRKCGSCGFEYFVNPSSANVAFILNDKEELLVERRKNNPAKGTFDLPGGFADMNETVEEGLAREVMEETGLEVTETKYMFSKPNTYHYSGVDIPTLDMFFSCKVKDNSVAKANDDAAECMWVPLRDIRVELFGLNSIRTGLTDFIASYNNLL
jgi:NADH pyrophosphatase NudC (nudix superfamily)